MGFEQRTVRICSLAACISSLQSSYTESERWEWNNITVMVFLRAFQILRNAMRAGVYGSAQISDTNMHGPTLLALRGGGLVSNLQKKALCNT